MGARLRFAIASARAHSILLLDEALAVGDRRFRLKSEERIRSLRDAAGLVMIVSHSAGSLKETCERGLWIHKGELRADGDIKDVVAEYTRWTKDPKSVAVGAASKPKAAVATPVNSPAQPGGAETSAIPIPADSAANPRSAARRARFLEETRRRSRRRTLTIGITGAAIVLAVGAGAAVALVNQQSNRIELEELRSTASNSPTQSPTASTAAQLPVINAFTATTAVCETVDSTTDVLLTWDVMNASGVTITVAGLDGVAETILDAQPVAGAGQAVAFACANESIAYTLVTSNDAGQQVTSTVVVSRELAPQPEASPPVDDAPAQPADPPEQTAPPVGPEPTEPPVEPTEPPVEPTEPPVEPTEPPVEPTEPPVEPTEPPAESAPVVPIPEPTDP